MSYYTNPTDAMVQAFGHGADLSKVPFTKIADAFAEAGFEDPDWLAHEFRKAVLPPKLKFV